MKASQVCHLKKGGKVVGQARSTPVVAARLQNQTHPQGAQADLALEVIQCAGLSCGVV